jgi:hypothetical protein
MLELYSISYQDRICGVMVSVLASIEVDRGFEPRSGQTKDYKIDICCFSAKHAALRIKSKDWLALNQDNVSEWGDMSNHRLLLKVAELALTNNNCYTTDTVKRRQNLCP